MGYKANTSNQRKILRNSPCYKEKDEVRWFLRVSLPHPLPPLCLGANHHFQENLTQAEKACPSSQPSVKHFSAASSCFQASSLGVHERRVIFPIPRILAQLLEVIYAYWTPLQSQVLNFSLLPPKLPFCLWGEGKTNPFLVGFKSPYLHRCSGFYIPYSWLSPTTCWSSRTLITLQQRWPINKKPLYYFHGAVV